MTRSQLSRSVPTVLPVLLLALTATGCNAVQERINDVATDALDSAIEQEANRRLSEAGVELAAPVDCSTDGEVGLDTLSGDIVTNCGATTADGRAVSATFDGIVETDGCDGVLTIVVGGETVYDGAVTRAECSL